MEILTIETRSLAVEKKAHASQAGETLVAMQDVLAFRSTHRLECGDMGEDDTLDLFVRGGKVICLPGDRIFLTQPSVDGVAKNISNVDDKGLANLLNFSGKGVMWGAMAVQEVASGVSETVSRLYVNPAEIDYAVVKTFLPSEVHLGDRKNPIEMGTLIPSFILCDWLVPERGFMETRTALNNVAFINVNRLVDEAMRPAPKGARFFQSINPFAPACDGWRRSSGLIELSFQSGKAMYIVNPCRGMTPSMEGDVQLLRGSIAEVRARAQRVAAELS